jgi:hypothetical protein
MYETELKNLAIALGGVRRGLRGRDYGGNNVQYKSDLNCHFKCPSLPHNEYILI